MKSDDVDKSETEGGSRCQGGGGGWDIFSVINGGKAGHGFSEGFGQGL